MKCLKKEYRRPRAENGFAVNLVTGMFFLLVLFVLLLAALSLRKLYATADYMEDALAGTGLALMQVDLKEYGRSGRLCFEEEDRIWDRYCEILRENLNLNEGFENPEGSLFYGRVCLEQLELYTVTEDEIIVTHFDSAGNKSVRIEQKNHLLAPDQSQVCQTGIYGEIQCFSQDYFGQKHRIRKGKLVDVVAKKGKE